MAYFNRNDRSGDRRSFGQNRDFRGRDRDRQMYKAVCAKCGKECEVPFKPSDRPVFCNDCFRENRKSDERRPEGRDFRRPNFEKRFDSGNRADQGPQYKEQFEKLNNKVDKILNILSTLTYTKPAPAVEEKKAEEVKEVQPMVEVLPTDKPKKKRKSSKKATAVPAE